MSSATRGQRLVHRQVDIGVAGDALLVAERLQERLADRDAGVLGRVVLVDMEVAGDRDLEVEEGMAREKLQHVVEEADAGRDRGLAGAVERKAHGHVGLGGAAADARGRMGDPGSWWRALLARRAGKGHRGRPYQFCSLRLK